VLVSTVRETLMAHSWWLNSAGWEVGAVRARGGRWDVRGLFGEGVVLENVIVPAGMRERACCQEKGVERERRWEDGAMVGAGWGQGGEEEYGDNGCGRKHEGGKGQ